MRTQNTEVKIHPCRGGLGIKKGFNLPIRQKQILIVHTFKRTRHYKLPYLSPIPPTGGGEGELQPSGELVVS